MKKLVLSTIIAAATAASLSAASLVGNYHVSPD